MKVTINVTAKQIMAIEHILNNAFNGVDYRILENIAKKIQTQLRKYKNKR